jgi:hypothetical protein
MAVYVGSAAMQPQGPDVRGGLIVHLGDKVGQFKEQLEKITQRIPPGVVTSVPDGKTTWQSTQPFPNVKYTWGTKGEYFMVALGENEMQALVKRAFGKTPAWLTGIRKNAGVERISTVAYVNVKSVLQLVAQQGPPNAAQVIESFGLSNLSNVTLVSGLDKTGLVSKMNLNFDGTPSGIFQFVAGKPLAAADFAAVPADTVSATVAKFDAPAIYDAFLKIAEQVDPKSKGEMTRNIGAMEAQFGLKLRDDILQPLGDTISTYNTMKGMGPALGTAVVSLKDAQKAKETNGKLVQILKSLGANPAAPKIIEVEFEGKTLYGLQMAGASLVQQAWCITDKELVFATTVEGLQEYLKRPTDFKSLAQSPEIAKNFKNGSAPIGMFYLDTKQLFDKFYPMAGPALQMFGPMLQSQGISLNPSILPSPKAISPHLLPLMVSVRKTSTGIEITERSSLPMPVLTSPANPMAIALLLPAVQSSRGAARRAQSTNNLKQIALAMHNYHDARKTFPPAFKADKDGKPLLSWRVLILPQMEYDSLYQQFKLDEPWDSEHNKKLLDQMPMEYKSPTDAGLPPGMTHYMTVRGEKSAFPGGKALRIVDIRDGSSNTIMTVEADKAVPWTKPDDFEYDENNPVKGLGSLHPTVFLAGFVDGSVHPISNSIDANMLKALFTRDGREAVDHSMLP